MALDLGIFLEGAGSSYKVKVSENDQLAQFLKDKIVSSDNSVTITETNNGSTETLDLTVSGGGASINDGAINTTETWSSDKINTEIGNIETIFTGGTLSGDSTVDLDENQLTFYLGTSTSRLVDKCILIDGSGIDHGSPNTVLFDIKNPNRSIFYMTHKGELISTSESSLIANLRNSTNDKGLYLDQTSSTFRGTSLNFSFEGNSSQPYILNTNVSSSSQLRWYKNSSTLEHRIRSGTSNSLVTFFEGGVSSSGFIIGSSSKVSSEDISLQGHTLIQGDGSTSGTTSFEVQNSSGSKALEILDDLAVIMPNLPTSASGLATGQLWNNSGVINIA